uniref:Galactokinase n=1 Tax=Timema tahoe TaxID=61484 RepID=A0A7R9IHL2_9NEOP|nr:unnamed protein product [Timema tahoe]
MDGDRVMTMNAMLPRQMPEILGTVVDQMLCTRSCVEGVTLKNSLARVNLIGEHVDYCGYSVCPMAIKNSIIIAVKTILNDVIKIVNTDSNYGHSYKNNVDQLRIEVKPGEAPAWYCYVLCGIKGVLEAIPSGQKPVGLSLAVTGNVPQASGLSSSSALVCAAALATAHANKLDISRKGLANLCAKAEQYIGTQGGGMDQAIALLATTGSAKHIYFNPLRSEDVQLPDECVFVIANSLSELNKAETHHYNTRVAECCLANQKKRAFEDGLTEEKRKGWERYVKEELQQGPWGISFRIASGKIRPLPGNDVRP